MKTTALVLMSLAVAGCGGRSLPAADGGSGQTPDGAQPNNPSTPGPEPGCLTNADCLQGEYCHLETGCVATAAAPGACRQRPDGCPLYATPPPPVCGCDGKTYDGACEAERAGVNVAHQGACTDDPACESVSCAVFNDCCQCEAVDLSTHPQPKECLAICEAPMCQAWGFSQPSAYCLSGMCFLAESATACTSDADCGLVNDCCACMALPTWLAKYVANACAADCYQGRCSAMGLGSVKARCQGGLCRLGF
jgi:hypothetical protein